MKCSVREFISGGNEEREYKLSVTDKLKKSNSLGSMLRNFSELVIDSAGYPSHGHRLLLQIH